MYIEIKNENYGYANATYGDYVVVTNPAITRYDSLSASIYHTGSIDYFRYNKNTDQHDYIGTFYKPWIDINILLARESDRKGIQTEDTGSIPFSNNKGLLIDKNNYTGSYEDGFGVSVDMYNKYLVVGCPYFTEFVNTYAYTITASGGVVNIYNLDYTEVTSISASESPLIFSIDDLDYNVELTNSFGQAVSINNDWIAVGSPFVSGSYGMVYMYRNISTGSNYSWSLYQKIESSDIVAGGMFGASLELNKATGSYSSSLVIGCGSFLNSYAYYYEFISGSWQQTFKFYPSYETASLTFANYEPYELTMPTTNGFGKSVSTYGTAVIVGEYLDRFFYEYSGSSLYQQGSVYIFEKCNNLAYTKFEQVLKTYGTPLTLKNNYAGFSVDIFGNNAVAGIPKIDNLTSCYIGGTLEQLHYCTGDLQNLLCGQAMLIQKNTSSGDWEVTNVYQKKKKYLSPYRKYGYNVAIADKSMVVGAPIILTDDNREINISTTQSYNTDLDDVAGKSYIYNLKNLRYEFHVGNVFYRNGKIILMTSGSIFDGLFFNPINVYTYEYDLQFKGQHTIFEKQIICTIDPGEFNISTNPTATVKQTSSLDINGNGQFDYQDLDILLRYMQYKNTSILGTTISTNWSSSIVTRDDEISLLKYYETTYDNSTTSIYVSQSIVKWETTDTWIQDILDLNDDNKIDIRDMNIMWKYFTNRLTQDNYASYITPACNRKLFSDIIDYMESLTQKNAKPLINPAFFGYESSVATDKTGSYLAPMVTTIGLYAGLDLVAVAKLGTPIKITPELPVNFVVKMDY